MTFPVLVLAVLLVAAVAALSVRLTGEYGIGAIAAGAAILFLHGPLYARYTSDDAYISYRYAFNLSEGLGLVWNRGEQVEGYSNFLWVMMLAGAHRAGADIVLTGRWLGFAAGIAALALTYLLTRRLLDGDSGRIAGFVAVLLLAASPPFGVWSSAGLEVPLFALLTTGAVLLHLREQRDGSFALSGAAWGLVSMTRPEGPLLFAISGIAKCTEAALRAREAPERRLRALAVSAAWLLAWIALFAATWGVYFAWRYTFYDHLFPNTYYAKVGSGLGQYDRGLQYFAEFARHDAAWLLLLAPVAAVATRIRSGAVWYIAALLAGWFAYVVYVGGDSLVWFRFFAPMQPLAWALIAASGVALLRLAHAERGTDERALALVAALVVGGMMAFLLQSGTSGFAYGFSNEREAVADREQMGRWLREAMPEDTVIAAVPVGALAYESRLTTIDMLGINDEHIAHRDLSIGTLAAGHEKYDTSYVLGRSPDIIILIDATTAVPARKADYEQLGLNIIPALIDIVATPELWERYEPRVAPAPEGGWFNVLVRKDANDALAATKAPPAWP